MSAHKLVFVVGCPRSGTTWIQLLLEQHPKVASGPESHVFEWYLKPLLETWEMNERVHPGMGLFSLMPASEFDEMLRVFVKTTLAKFTEHKPKPEILLEKTPWHLLHHEVILRLFPDAKILHIIRDPRSIAASFKAANEEGWARGWSSGKVDGSAELWLRAMNHRPAVAAAATNYREVRYEDVKADTSAVLASLFDWIGLEATPQFCAQATENCDIEKLRNNQTKGLAERIKDSAAMREFFYRRGDTSGWRSDLTPREIKTVEFLAKDEMRELGYVLDFDPPKKPLSLRYRQTKRRLKRRLEPLARKISDRLTK